MVLGKLKFIEEEKKYILLEVNDQDYFYYTNKDNPIAEGYRLDKFLKQYEKYFSYKTKILSTHRVEVEIIFHNKADEVLYFLQN
jgi:hypothetical protein